MANSVDPDQMQQNAASDLGLCCLNKPVHHNTLGQWGMHCDNKKCRKGNISTFCIAAQENYRKFPYFMLTVMQKLEILLLIHDMEKFL